LLLGISLGLLVFAAGAALAGAILPEWEAGRPQAKSLFRERYRELAARGGFVLQPGEPRVRLVTRGIEGGEPFRSLGDAASGWLRATRTAVRVEVFHGVVRSYDRSAGNLAADFSLDGRAQAVTWWSASLHTLFTASRPEDALPVAAALGPLLLHPEESLGPVGVPDLFLNQLPRVMVPIVGSAPPQFLVVMGKGSVVAGRWAGPLTEEAPAAVDAYQGRLAKRPWKALIPLLPIAGLFLTLLIKSRISMVNGTLLAVASLLTLNPAPTPQLGSWALSLPAALGMSVWIFLLWSSAESLLRSTSGDFTTSLDALRAGRLGPRGGQALLVGLAFGGGLAGLRLGLLSLLEVVPGVWSETPSLSLPAFSAAHSPLLDGAALAGSVALALAVAVRWVPLRWSPAVAALGAALLSPLAIQPFAAGLAVNATLAGVLVYVCRRHGLTALLTAAVCSLLLPAALFAALYLSFLPGTFAATAGLTVGIAALGLLGVSRPAAGEIQRLAPPAFVRRLEEERRLKHEMGLLARMQRGLLPRTLPRLPGYELAARSELANEAGGDLYDVLTDDEGFVWIAAGDVAGHGYSCAIAQAMTKAALASLAGRGRTPAEVLWRADRVLRAAGPTRHFTTLTLLRLRPETGEALVANAGHPYPLLAAGGEVTEIALSGLPLGAGPPRRYEDRVLTLPPGSTLVLSSDGLFEATNDSGAVYGFDRLRDVLRDIGPGTAEKVLETVFADWKRHLRGSLSLDDTTVVVLRRLEEPG
jgi:serine phosphatase RsbU (regulator of sigma subunit)